MRAYSFSLNLLFTCGATKASSVHRFLEKSESEQTSTRKRRDALESKEDLEQLWGTPERGERRKQLVAEVLLSAQRSATCALRGYSKLAAGRTLWNSSELLAAKATCFAFAQVSIQKARVAALSQQSAPLTWPKPAAQAPLIGLDASQQTSSPAASGSQPAAAAAAAAALSTGTQRLLVLASQTAPSSFNGALETNQLHQCALQSGHLEPEIRSFELFRPAPFSSCAAAAAATAQPN